MFERSCGATTGFSTQVSVVAAGSELPNEGGNVLVLVPPKGDPRFRASGYARASVRWAAPTRLIIEFNKQATPLLQEQRIGDVSIEYQLTER